MTPNQISLKTGLLLRSASDKFIKQAFQLNPKVYSVDDIIKSFPGVKAEFVLMDTKYWVESYDTWKELLSFCWIPEKQYAVERFDCDNFAQTFQSWGSWYFDLNTAGRVFGGAYKLDGTFIQNHYWSVILTKDANDKLHLYMIEPQNLAITEYTGQDELVLGNMRVRPVKIYFS